MAVQTGTGASSTQSALTEEQKKIVARAKRPVDTANRFRLLFLFIGLMGVLFLYLGNKFWQEMAWYNNFVPKLYLFLLGDILLMLLATLAKLGFATRYNHIVKKL